MTDHETTITQLRADLLAAETDNEILVGVINDMIDSDLEVAYYRACAVDVKGGNDD